jgi:hypothetical protein
MMVIQLGEMDATVPARSKQVIGVSPLVNPVWPFAEIPYSYLSWKLVMMAILQQEMAVTKLVK